MNKEYKDGLQVLSGEVKDVIVGEYHEHDDSFGVGGGENGEHEIYGHGGGGHGGGHGGRGRGFGGWGGYGILDGGDEGDYYDDSTYIEQPIIIPVATPSYVMGATEIAGRPWWQYALVAFGAYTIYKMTKGKR